MCLLESRIWKRSSCTITGEGVLQVNIYRQELRAHLKNTLIWMASLCGALVLFFAIFPSFASAADDMVKLMEGFPKEVQNSFGVPIKLIPTVNGYYSFILTYLVLCGAIQAMHLGLAVLGKEAAGKTVDFLLTKPVTRAQALTAKLLAAFTLLAATSAVYLAAAVASAQAVSFGFAMKPFLLLSLSFFFVQLIFLALGFLVAAIAPKIRSMLPVALGTAIGFFILGMIAAALEERKLFVLTPFKYFDTAYILTNQAYEPLYPIIGAAFVVLSVIAAFWVYRKKDIHA